MAKKKFSANSLAIAKTVTNDDGTESIIYETLPPVKKKEWNTRMYKTRNNKLGSKLKELAEYINSGELGYYKEIGGYSAFYTKSSSPLRNFLELFFCKPQIFESKQVEDNLGTKFTMYFTNLPINELEAVINYEQDTAVGTSIDPSQLKFCGKSREIKKGCIAVEVDPNNAFEEIAKIKAILFPLKYTVKDVYDNSKGLFVETDMPFNEFGSIDDEFVPTLLNEFNKELQEVNNAEASFNCDCYDQCECGLTFVYPSAETDRGKEEVQRIMKSYSILMGKHLSIEFTFSEGDKVKFYTNLQSQTRENFFQFMELYDKVKNNCTASPSIDDPDLLRYNIWIIKENSWCDEKGNLQLITWKYISITCGITLFHILLKHGYKVTSMEFCSYDFDVSFRTNMPYSEYQALFSKTDDLDTENEDSNEED